MLDDTQADVFEVGKDLPNIQSAYLGNALRATCGKLATELEEKLSGVIDRFRSEMIKLIEAEDKEIVERQVGISESNNTT